MAESVGSTVPGRQLARALRELRSEAGITVAGVAKALECSPQKVWRIESGAGAVRGREVRAMCELYGARPELTTELTSLAAQVGARGWWYAHGGTIPGGFDLHAGLEAAACRLREYQSGPIPALLQTREYASALHARNPGVAEDAAKDAGERLVEARLRRQSLLWRRFPAPPRFDVMLSEAVLLAGGNGSELMSGQLRHLTEVSTLPHVSIRVVPLAAGQHPGSLSGPFVILDFPPGQRVETEPPVVYREFLTGALYLDRAEEIAAYEQVWADLDAVALDEEASRDLLK